MKKILLSSMIIILLSISIIIAYLNNSTSTEALEKITKFKANYKSTIKLWKINTNPKSAIDFWQSHEDEFEFHESELSSNHSPRFIGKSNNEHCKDLIIVNGKDEDFFINYISPINDNKSLQPSSIENMKTMLKFMSPSINNLNNMDYWERIINEKITNSEEKVIFIDNIRIDIYINIYSNSLVLNIEKLSSYK